MQLSMNEITTFRWSFEEDVENYVEAGYDAIGVWLQKVTDFGEDRAIDLLATSRLKVSNVVWTGGFTGSDVRTLSEAVEETVRAIRLSAAMQAGCLVVYPGGRNNHTLRHAGRLLRNALDKLLAIAEIVEIPLAIEPMHPACAAEWTFFTDLADTLYLLGEYNSRYLRLALDMYHFPLSNADDALYSELVDHLAIVHVGDRSKPPSIDQERCLLGDGTLPLRRGVGGLTEAGYRGHFDVKLIGTEIETTSYRKTLLQSKQVFDRMAGLCTPIT